MFLLHEKRERSQPEDYLIIDKLKGTKSMILSYGISVLRSDIYHHKLFKKGAFEYLAFKDDRKAPSEGVSVNRQMKSRWL